MKNPSIALVGVGGVGSLLIPALREFQPALLTIIDFDLYEDKNLERQPISRGNAGIHKVAALYEVYDSEGLPIHPIPYACDHPDSQLYLDSADLIIAAVDNNDARNYLYDKAYTNGQALIYCANENTSGQCHLLYPGTYGTEIDPWVIHPELKQPGATSPDSCSRNPLDQTYATNTMTAAAVISLLRLQFALGFKPIIGQPSAVYYTLRSFQHKLPYVANTLEPLPDPAYA